MSHKTSRKPVAATSTLLAAAALSLLSACSSVDTEPPAASTLVAANSSAAAADKDYYTGSRLARKTTDRMIRRTDAAGAKEMARDMPPNPGPKFN